MVLKYTHTPIINGKVVNITILYNHWLPKLISKLTGNAPGFGVTIGKTIHFDQLPIGNPNGIPPYLVGHELIHISQLLSTSSFYPLAFIIFYIIFKMSVKNYE